jgi:exosortase A-associated hydrolase 2
VLSGHFIPSAQGNLFITQFGTLNTNTAILCIPSIVEELNLSRAVVAKQAQTFAKQGLPCIVLDYFGTGDSDGEFEQSSCELWLENILTAGEWLKQQGIEKIILWGVRFGALMMFSYQKELHDKLPIIKQMMWKPVTSGKQFAGQFLRIKQVSSMLNNAEEKVNWRQYILDGNDTEVAGYLMTKNWLTSVERMVIDKNFSPLSPLYWFELGALKPTPIMTRLSSIWKKTSYQIHCVEMPAFWQVPEIFSLGNFEQVCFDILDKELIDE